ERKAAVSDKIIDVTSVFANTTSKVIQKALKGGVVYAVNLTGFSGLVGKEIQPGRRLGTELSDRARKSGVGGIFHTDELPNYGITKEEVEALRKAVSAREMDCVVMVADSKERSQGAMEAVMIRAKEALEFIPEETRRALPDGNSAYMRPLPGAARMYPETDVTPVVITEERIKGIKLPELIGERKARYIKQFSLNEDLANQMARSVNSIIFDRIMQQVPEANPNSVVRVLETILYELEKEGVEVNKITDDHLMQLFRLQSEGKIPNEAISNILKTISLKPDLYVYESAESLGIGGVKEGELETAVDKLIEEKMDFVKEKGLNAVGPLMGLIMKDFRGKVSGGEVNRLLKKKISKKFS
ncbi:MAG TPA: Glu-tRNA(Gln) amidotransferase subunit GatE, partial [Candidatus Methanoperedens sp.]|nr:Glu-tRNA(Gln) amidotransferase subunit GatE [Candidatus Methanoperedens sp.]